MASRFESQLGAAERNATELMDLLAQRDRMAAAHASTKQVSRSVREKQRTFNKRVKEAQSSLNSMQRDPEGYSVSSRDVEAYAARMSGLLHQQEDIKLAVQNPGAAERSALMSGAAGAGGTAPAMPGGETARSANMSNTQMMAQFDADMKEQDDILGDLEAGADRLKVVGQAIGDESDAHVRLLDDIEDEMDTANANLKKETRHIRRVTVRTQFCWLYVVLCLLIVALGGLVILRWG